LIGDCKSSGTVHIAPGGNPKPPKDKVVCTWVKNARQNVEVDFIKESIVNFGFHSNFEEYHITRHEVFGAHFNSCGLTMPQNKLMILHFRKDKLMAHFLRE